MACAAELSDLLEGGAIDPLLCGGPATRQLTCPLREGKSAGLRAVNVINKYLQLVDQVNLLGAYT